MAKFKYAVVIRGEVEARNRSSAYQLLLMSVNVNLRTMMAKHEIGIDIRDLDVAEQQADDAAAKPIPATEPFVREDGRQGS